MNRIVPFALVLLATCATAAQDEGFWAFLEEGRPVRRCDASWPAHGRARQQLDRLDARIRALGDADPVAEAVSQLHGLLRTECFLPAAETKRIPRPDTALSLKHWWIDQGGWYWLESFLDLPRMGTLPNLTGHVVLPPDARETLTLDAHGDHPLREILCSLSDRSCGAETRGWKLRAAAHFASQRTAGVPDADNPFERSDDDARAVAKECAARVGDIGADQRYQHWRRCLETARPQQFTLPLGDFKAPTSGWFIVSGRRGHYAFCDTTRAYDLASGAAFVDDSCSGLALLKDGSVDVPETDKSRRPTLRAGVIPVDNLREAVWMILLRSEATLIQLSAESYPLPAGMTPLVHVVHADDDEIPMGWMHTGQTTLTWRWAPNPGVTFAGELTWPNSSDAAEDHAAALLDVAEQGFVERCQTTRPPSLSTVRLGRPRVLNEIDQDRLAAFDRDFAEALKRWGKLPPCRPAH